METLELNNMELVALDAAETKETNGGFLAPAIIAAFVISAINNFHDIREGLVDGYNGTPRH